MTATKARNSKSAAQQSQVPSIKIVSATEMFEQERERRFLAYQERKREQREERALVDG